MIVEILLLKYHTCMMAILLKETQLTVSLFNAIVTFLSKESYSACTTILNA